jgi:hypothetical protein
MPKLFTFAGDHLGIPARHVLGWWTGPDSDLMCVRPHRTTNELAEYALSPVSTSKALAVIGFLLKNILLCLDWNLHPIYSDKNPPPQVSG